MHSLHHNQTWPDMELPQRGQRLDTNRSNRYSPPTQRRATVIAPLAATRSQQSGPPQRQGGTESGETMKIFNIKSITIKLGENNP